MNANTPAGGSDVNMRQGTYPYQKKAPLTPGYSMVGTVNKNGPRCSTFQPGDLVACLTVYDADAQLVNLPEKYLIKVPSGLDLQQATAMILDWTTAYGMVEHKANISRGTSVFIHGMSGAVGQAIMILCRLRGATIYGTAAERNHQAIREMGGTAFTYRNLDWMAEMKKIGGADVVFDALGFESFDRSYEILSMTGTVIGYGGNLPNLDGKKRGNPMVATLKMLSYNLTFGKRKTIFYYITRDQKTYAPDLKALFDLLRTGKVQVPIKAVFDLEDIQEAHRSWSKGDRMGSTVIRVSSAKA